ncbi:MAG TPA: alanine racemase [Candidatus Wallbacteria bacterium]|nr:alanine racemase [Candidatus Wallbacteria bacterium]
MSIDKTCWVEISRKALTANIDSMRARLAPKVKIMAVVKANAYGHGLLEVARIAAEHGVDFFGVNNLDEAVRLRNIKIKTPILALGYTPLANLKDAVNHDISIVAYNAETINRLQEIAAKYKKNARAHIKIETGLNRQGVSPQDLPDFIKLVKSKKNIEIEGISTHYANIEDTTEHSYARRQLENFQQAYELFQASQVAVKYRHTACTAAAILFDNVHFEMIRLGIGLYGLWPSKETKISAYERKIGDFNLAPVMKWKSIVAQVKSVEANSYIGYGCSDFVTQNSRIAIIPAGYYDGYDRKLSNSGYVIIRGRRAPVLGRICMNMFIVDVTNIEGVRPEDEVILLGATEDDAISAETLASKIGTINYEVVTRINESLPRLVTD